MVRPEVELYYCWCPIVARCSGTRWSSNPRLPGYKSCALTIRPKGYPLGLGQGAWSFGVLWEDHQLPHYHMQIGVAHVSPHIITHHLGPSISLAEQQEGSIKYPVCHSPVHRTHTFLGLQIFFFFTLLYMGLDIYCLHNYIPKCPNTHKNPKQN